MLTLAFAEGAPAAQASHAQQSPLLNLMPIALIFIIFYFLLIRPQKKTQQEHARMLENLKKNDEVVTAGGIFGTIVNIQDDVVTIRVDDNTRVKIQKKSISRLRKSRQSD